MFAQHQPTISAYGRSSAEGFARCGLLCIASARQPFATVGEAMREILGGRGASDLFAWKAQAWDQLQETATERLATLEALEAKRASDVAMLLQVTSWYGFGYVKGGFLLQMLYGRLGCLDTRNEAQFGLRYLRKRADTSLEARTQVARRYVRKVKSLGGCEFLWNNWCMGLAAEGNRFKSTWDVSAEHCRILGLDPGAEDFSSPPF